MEKKPHSSGKGFIQRCSNCGKEIYTEYAAENFHAPARTICPRCGSDENPPDDSLPAANFRDLLDL